MTDAATPMPKLLRIDSGTRADCTLTVDPLGQQHGA